MTINWQEALAVYFIAGTQDIQPNEELIDVLEESLKAGATCFQYREKGTGSMTNPDERLDMARRCQEVCKRYDVPFIINDDIDLAIEVKRMLCMWDSLTHRLARHLTMLRRLASR